jgi:predicted glycosyltransferase
VLVRGLPSEATPISVPSHVTVFNHLDTNELDIQLQQADYIIGRGGYTSLMELLSIDKKLIVVPTPGQTEQEYLSGLLMKTKRLLRITQDQFSLNESYLMAQQFTFSKMNLDQFDLEQLKALLLNLPK